MNENDENPSELGVADIQTTPYYQMMFHSYPINWMSMKSHYSSYPILWPNSSGSWMSVIHRDWLCLLVVSRDNVDGKKSCTTLDGWNPINNGINHLSTGAGFRIHPPYLKVILFVLCDCWAQDQLWKAALIKSEWSSPSEFCDRPDEAKWIYSWKQLKTGRPPWIQERARVFQWFVQQWQTCPESIDNS